MSNYNLGTAVGRIVIDGSGAEKGFKVASEAANVFYGIVQKKLDSIDQLGTKLIAVGTAGTAGLGSAVKTAAKFEAGLSGVKAVSGATTAEMELLRKAALRIGKDTSFSASEAVDAIQELTKAGVSTKDILNGAADATVSLAAAGELDLPRAAEIASSAINNFALSGKELPHVADLIAGAANASAIDVGDFGFSLSQAGAVANLVGLKFDDLAVAIAEMGQAGIKGSDAGTSIKTFLSNLIPTTDKQRALFKELGLVTVKTGADFSKLTAAGLKPASSSMEDVTKSLEAYVEKTGGAKQGTVDNAKSAQELGIQMGIVGNAFFNAKGEMLPFKDVQETLSKATKGLSKEQKLMALDTLFGSDAIRASAVFANQGAAGFDKMSGAIGKVKAADVAKTRLDNLNGSIEQLKGSFETAQIIIGEVFLPAIKNVVDKITGLINIFLNLPEGVQKAIAVIIGLGSVMSLATGIAIKLAFALGPVLARMLGFAAMRQVFSIFTVGIRAISSGAGVFASLAAMGGRAGVVFTRFARIGGILFNVLSKFPRILAVLRTASTLAFGPWGIALAAVVTGAILAYKHFKPFHDLVNQFAVMVKTTLLAGLALLQEAFGHIVEGFQMGTTSADGFVGKLQIIGIIASEVVKAAKDIAATFMQYVIPALQSAGGNLLGSLQEAWRSIVETWNSQVMPALRELGAQFEAMKPQLQQLWTALEPIAKVLGIIAVVIIGSLLVAVYLLIKGLVLLLPVIIVLITVGLQVLINIIQFLIQVVIAVVATFITWGKAIVDVVQNAISAVAQIIGGLVDVVKGVFNIIAGLFTGDWARMWDGAKQVVSGIKDAIVAIVTGLGKSLLIIVKGFITGIVDFFKNLYDILVGHSIVPDLVNAIIKWISTLPSKAAAALGGLASAVIGEVNKAMVGMYNGLVGGINNAINLMRSVPGHLIDALGNVGGMLKNAGQWIVQGLIDGIASWVGNLKNYLAGVTNLIPSWKGPMEVDKKLLTKNGVAIMKSLVSGFEEQSPKIEKFLGDLTKTISDGVTVPSKWTLDSGMQAALSSAAANKSQTPLEKIGTAIDTKSSTAKISDAVVQSTSERQVSVTNNNYIYNPVTEKSSTTLAREATRRASLGVLA